MITRPIFVTFLLAFVTLSGCAGQSAHAADPARGKELYAARCGGCHSLTDNGAGPRHWGLFGRRAGSQPGFDYSSALQASGIVWNWEQLDRWLTDPSALVPGNKMVVRLADDPRDRADILAYLSEATRRETSSTEPVKSPTAP